MAATNYPTVTPSSSPGLAAPVNTTPAGGIDWAAVRAQASHASATVAGQLLTPAALQRRADLAKRRGDRAELEQLYRTAQHQRDQLAAARRRAKLGRAVDQVAGGRGDLVQVAAPDPNPPAPVLAQPARVFIVGNGRRSGMTGRAALRT